MITYHPGHLLGENHPRGIFSIRNPKTGTHPCVLHANGPSKEGPTWRRILDLWKSQLLVIKWRANLEIATWNSSSGKCLLEEQLGFFKIPHVVLGRGKKWNFKFFEKITTLCQYKPGPKAEYVLFLDGFDILLNGYTDNIVEFLRKTDVDVLASAEENHHPPYTPTKQWEILINKGRGSPFLNSGIICIKASALLSVASILRRLMERDTIPNPQWGHDQCIWKIAYKTLYPRCQIDHRSEIFQNLYLNPPLDIKFSP